MKITSFHIPFFAVYLKMAGDFWSKCVLHKPVIQHNFKTIHSAMATLGTKKGEADSDWMVYWFIL